MIMRSIALLLIATAASAADLVAYSPTDGTTWVGWYDSQSRTFACPKPSVLIVLPEGAKMTPAKPPEGELPAQLKARGDALVKLGARIKRDSTNKASAELSRMRAADGEELERRGAALIEQAMAIQRALDEEAKAAKAATAAAVASQKAGDGAPPEFAAILATIERARAEETRAAEAVAAAQRELDAARGAVRKCAGPIDRMLMALIWERKDFSRVTVSIDDTASMSAAADVVSLNRMLDRLAKATGPNDHSWVGGDSFGMFLRWYCKYKPGWGWATNARAVAYGEPR